MKSENTIGYRWEIIGYWSSGEKELLHADGKIYNTRDECYKVGRNEIFDKYYVSGIDVEDSLYARLQILMVEDVPPPY